jgi:hypothetical protein
MQAWGGGAFGGWFVCAQSITIVVEPWLLRACMLVVSERARKSEGKSEEVVQLSHAQASQTPVAPWCGVHCTEKTRSMSSVALFCLLPPGPGNSVPAHLFRVSAATCDAPTSALVGGRKEGSRCNILALLQIGAYCRSPVASKDAKQDQQPCLASS